MSNPLLPDPPAHPDLRPGVPVFRRLASGEGQALRTLLGEGELLAMAEEGRHLLYRDPAGGQTFLKLIGAAGMQRQLKADAIARYLMANGVPSSCLLDGYPVVLSDGRHVLGYRYIAYRFALAGPEDMQRLGLLIGQLHKALASLPESKKIMARTRERMTLLRARAQDVLAGGGAGPDPVRLQSLLARENESLWEVLEGSGQCTHGDLHYTNVLFPEDGSGPIVLDFEDAPASWFPPALDLAQVLERFVLVARLDESEQQRLGIELLTAYGTVQDIRAILSGPPLVDCLRALSLRALLTLAELEAQRRPVAAAEWRKFFWLHQRAVTSRPVLDAIRAAVH